MKNSSIRFTLTGTPPRLIPTLVKGFNTIANNVYLILIPALLDLILWFGPKLRLKTLLLPTFTYIYEQMLKISPPELAETVETSQKLWLQTLEQLNLLTAVRTFPVGIPSLIARESPITSPLKTSLIFEVPNAQLAFTILGLAILIGFFLGTIYFFLIARVTSEEKVKLTSKQLFAAYLQNILLFCLVICVAVLITVPLMLVLSVLSMINTGIGQLFLLITIFALIWVIMPMVFAPYGIFVMKLKAVPSILLSIRMVRFFLPGTGLFVMTSALISEGLNMLWTMPEPTSWLTLLGIGGHSFIVTALIAASFYYYRDGLKWMQDNLQRAAAAAQPQPENGGNTLEQ